MSSETSKTPDMSKEPSPIIPRYPTTIEGLVSKEAYAISVVHNEDKYLAVARRAVERYGGIVTGAVATRLHGVPYVAVHDVDIITDAVDRSFSTVIDSVSVSVVSATKLPRLDKLLEDTSVDKIFVVSYPRNEVMTVNGLSVVTPEYLTAYWLMRILLFTYGKDIDVSQMTQEQKAAVGIYVPMRLRIYRAIAEYFLIKLFTDPDKFRVVSLLKHFYAYDIYRERIGEIPELHIKLAAAELTQNFGWNYFEVEEAIREALAAYL